MAPRKRTKKRLRKVTPRARRTVDSRVHVIDAYSTRAERAAARADLVGFFDDVLHKHHGGW